MKLVGFLIREEIYSSEQEQGAWADLPAQPEVYDLPSISDPHNPSEKIESAQDRCCQSAFG